MIKRFITEAKGNKVKDELKSIKPFIEKGINTLKEFRSKFNQNINISTNANIASTPEESKILNEFKKLQNDFLKVSTDLIDIIKKLNKITK